ncbi:monovalent cation:proton antiporter-2 (CPA2) family protein [Roseateles sp.]|uniref:monovalent cation:proton antiporter-2 (CPA2) family protein n=1 Tax=Roseateles sp. TaxID=1971397 RepID=UPI0039E7543E
MAAESSTGQLLPVVMLLGAAVVAVPLFKRLGLGSVLGYLAAGLAIGPFGLAWFTDPQTILHTAELGVVMFLFIIGLEMRPSHLWRMRRDIFGLGSLQVLVCAALLTAVGMGFGFTWAVSLISALGFVLTSTAIVMQLLSERGDIAAPRGQKVVAILLLEDLLIVPLLALVALLAPDAPTPSGGSAWATAGLAAAAVAALLAAGLWLLNPLFRVLAGARAREVMTAAALLVVLGAALLMQAGGLSMAMGAFLAGVLLSESTFRHQLEADIEPFRGLLLGLFFLGVGMSLDIAAVARQWQLVVAGVLALMAAKACCVYVVARLARATHADALDRAVLMAQGGEFAFVLFAAALAARVIDPVVNANMTAIVVLSMALTPLLVLLHKRLSRSGVSSTEGVEAPQQLASTVLIIGFGRVGQIASQHVLALGAQISIIDHMPQVARDAENFGFKVWYGDGRRLDVLRAAGAADARVILVCVDDAATATTIAELVSMTFPQARLVVRARDREHAITLIQHGVARPVRETFESAMQMGQEAALALGADEVEAQGIAADVRRRDRERLDLELAGGIDAGRSKILGNLDEHPAEGRG